MSNDLPNEDFLLASHPRLVGLPRSHLDDWLQQNRICPTDAVSEDEGSRNKRKTKSPSASLSFKSNRSRGSKSKSNKKVVIDLTGLPSGNERSSTSPGATKSPKSSKKRGSKQRKWMKHVWIDVSSDHDILDLTEIPSSTESSSGKCTHPSLDHLAYVFQTKTCLAVLSIS